MVAATFQAMRALAARIAFERGPLNVMTALVLIAFVSKPFWFRVAPLYPVAVIATGSAGVLAMALLFGYWRWRRDRFPHSRLSSDDIPWLITYLLGMLLLSAAFRQLVLDVSPMPPSWKETGLDALGWFDALILSPVVEEFFFRAWLMRRTPATRAAWRTVLLVSLAFSFAHLWVPETNWESWAMELQRIPFYLILSFGVSAVWLRTRSWVTCIAIHASFNGLVGLLL